MTDELALKPCPFCGGTNIQSLKEIDFVCCQDCGAFLEDSEPSARTLWNTRALSAQGEQDAIFSECAEIALEHAGNANDYTITSPYSRGYNEACRDIAEAIRTRASNRKTMDEIADKTDDGDLTKGVRWSRVNDEPFEYAIQIGPHGDAFVKLLNGRFLKRRATDVDAALLKP
jgi:Lar family restriction alleviation protein